MNLKIVSDGTAFNTRIVDADTGADVSSDLRCTRIEVDVSDGPVRATFSVVNVPLDMVLPDVLFEREASVYYDPDNTDSIERAIAELERQKLARLSA